MTRSRKTGKGLPRRVYLTYGAYRFHSPTPISDPKDGKLKKIITLAYEHEGEPAMYAALAVLLQDKKSMTGSMPYCCEEYRRKKLTKYSKETIATYTQYLQVISGSFEDYHAVQVTTKDCADFLRENFGDKENTAQKYSALMRRLFKFIIGELGLRQTNPLDQLDLSDYETVRRIVLIEAFQYQKAYAEIGRAHV